MFQGLSSKWVEDGCDPDMLFTANVPFYGTTFDFSTVRAMIASTKRGTTWITLVLCEIGSDFLQNHPFPYIQLLYNMMAELNAV